MVKFSINEDSMSKHYKEIFIYRNRYSLIVSLILIIVWICLGIYGIVRQNDSTIFLALGFICLELLLILMNYVSLNKTLKQALKSFNDLYPSGERICEVKLVNNTINIKEIVLGTESNIKVENIKNTKILKSIIIFKLVDKNYIYLPKSDEIIKELNINTKKFI